MQRRALFLVMALLLGTLAAFLVYGQIREYRRQLRAMQITYVKVPIAARPIPQLAQIESDDIAFVDVPPEFLPAWERMSMADLVGQTAVVGIPKGDLLLRNKLSPAGSTGGISFLISPDDVAVAVPVDEVVGAGGFIIPGDRVDLLHVAEEEEAQAAPSAEEGDTVVAGGGGYASSKLNVARILLSDVRVLAFGEDVDKTRKTEEREKKTKKPGSGTAGESSMPREITSRSALTALLEVTPEQSTVIAWAQSNGKFLLALRSARSVTPSPENVYAGPLPIGALPEGAYSAAAPPTPAPRKDGATKTWKIEMIVPGERKTVEVSP